MSSLYFVDREDRPCPVKCDYCATVNAVGSNCKNCGGPLPKPEVVEEVIERRINLSRDMIDVTSWSDPHRVFQAGILRGEAQETVISRRRVK